MYLGLQLVIPHAKILLHVVGALRDARLPPRQGERSAILISLGPKLQLISRDSLGKSLDVLEGKSQFLLVRGSLFSIFVKPLVSVESLTFRGRYQLRDSMIKSGLLLAPQILLLFVLGTQSVHLFVTNANSGLKMIPRGLKIVNQRDGLSVLLLELLQLPFKLVMTVVLAVGPPLQILALSLYLI